MRSLFLLTKLGGGCLNENSPNVLQQSARNGVLRLPFELQSRNGLKGIPHDNRVATTLTIVFKLI